MRTKKPESETLKRVIRVLVNEADLREITRRRGHESASSYGRRMMTTGIDPDKR